MQIKNTGPDARTLSRDGVDVPLFPGASVEYPLTEDEAEAYRGIGFTVTGEPAPAKPVTKSKE